MDPRVVEHPLGLVCVGILALISVGGILVFIFGIKLLTETKEAYYKALDRLKRDPHNPELRQEVISLDRKYIKMNYKKFNEVMLMNDINAACAKAGSEVMIRGNSQQSGQKPSVEERLRKLDELRARRVISDTEHAARRQEILNEI